MTVTAAGLDRGVDLDLTDRNNEGKHCSAVACATFDLHPVSIAVAPSGCSLAAPCAAFEVMLECITDTSLFTPREKISLSAVCFVKTCSFALSSPVCTVAVCAVHRFIPVRG